MNTKGQRIWEGNHPEVTHVRMKRRRFTECKYLCKRMFGLLVCQQDYTRTTEWIFPKFNITGRFSTYS